jgi:hypothetical protein
MRGVKNVGQILEGVDERGLMKSEKANINFTVPSVAALSDFNLNEMAIEKSVSPGVLQPILDALQANNPTCSQEYMLCADAKKSNCRNRCQGRGR